MDKIKEYNAKRSTIKNTIGITLFLIIYFLCVRTCHHSLNYYLPYGVKEFMMERHESPSLPFVINVFSEITWEFSPYQRWYMSVRNKNNGTGCFIRHIGMADAEDIRTLLYINPDTVRYLIDDNHTPSHSTFGEISLDLSTAVKDDGIDIQALSRRYYKESDGTLMETIIPDLEDTTTWRQTPVVPATGQAVYDPELKRYQYLIAIDEIRNMIWVYDSNDSIVYRSPELLKYHEESPYMARRHEQKVL